MKSRKRIQWLGKLPICSYQCSSLRDQYIKKKLDCESSHLETAQILDHEDTRLHILFGVR